MGAAVTGRGDLEGAQAADVSAVRLPSWDEVLAPGAPWALLLRSGPAGVWLLRGTAEEDGVDARVVVGAASATSADAFGEWAAALELGERAPRGWSAFADAVGEGSWVRGGEGAVLVCDAGRLLADEPARLPTLLAALREASARLLRNGVALRLVFQSRCEHDPDRLAVFREFDVADIA